MHIAIHYRNCSSDLQYVSTTVTGYSVIVDTGDAQCDELKAIRFDIPACTRTEDTQTVLSWEV